MFSRFFIHRPIFAGVISIAIVLIGLISMASLPIARYPAIAPPTVEVSAVYPGADAQTVAQTVATPIEQEVNGVEGMAYLTSTSSSDGSMSLTVTFEIGTDLDMASVHVQNRVSVAEPRLPSEVTRQGVTVKKKSTDTTLFVTLYSPDRSVSDLDLSNYATLYIRDQLARVPGVGDVQVFGAGDYGMRIWLDPELMHARRITTTDVVNAIGEQNVQIAAGKIGGPPAPPGQVQQLTVNAKGRLRSPEQFERIVLRAGQEGQLVYLRDVARVEIGSANYDIVSRFNEAPCAALAVYQLPGANAISIADGVRASMARLAQRFPPGMEHAIPFDSTDVIRASIREVVLTLFITVTLVVLTVFAFLQNLRATLIPAITIPVSLIGTFAVMAALGYTINQLTLFGLVLVIGIVVDDAIVVVENVSRHIEQGMKPKEATEKAMGEVTGPVIATTLVLLAVFVPTLFMRGISGQLFGQFAVTISIATVFSSINALTLSPALCGVLLRAPRKPFVLFRAFNWSLQRTTSGYEWLVRRVIRAWAVAVVIFALLLGLGAIGMSRLPTMFVPMEDEGWLLVSVELPDGATLARTDQTLAGVSEQIAGFEGVSGRVAIAGFSMVDGAVIASRGTLVVTLEPWDARTGPALHMRAILRRINRTFADRQDALVSAFPPPPIPGVGMAGGFALQVQDRAGEGLQSLNRVVRDLVDAGASQRNIARIATGFNANVPQLFVDIDREQAKALSVPLGDVFGALQAYLGSAYVNDVTLFGRTYQVRLQADARFRAEPDDIRKLEVRNASGQMIPLGTIVSVEDAIGAQLITRHNAYPSAKVTGIAAPGVSSGDARATIRAAAGATLPSSMGFEWTELSYQEMAGGGQAAAIFLFSVLLVYLFLAAQYESWSIPLAVCLAVPAALVGAVAGQLVRVVPSSVYTQIGIVLLIGLSAKTSILIVEFARAQRRSGMGIDDAAVSAARLRFRAVLMTAFSFILGVLPLLVAGGAGGESRKALGTVVFSGMIVATGVGVLVVPMFYRVIQTLSERISGRGARSSGTSP